MNNPFPGFPAEAMQFFRGLARNNNRDWFQPRKPVFEEMVKRPMVQLVEAINAALREFAPDYVTDPAQAIYRFYRDTRFSNDKTPYKDHIAAYFTRRGLVRHQGAGYYFQVSHKSVGIGGGVYMPPPETLLAIRRHIAEHHEEYREIANAAALRRIFGEVQGDQLARLPKGFAKDHPAGDLLRNKQFLLWAEHSPDLAASPKLFTEIRRHFHTMAPFVEFLNTPLRTQKKRLPGGITAVK